MSLSLKSVEAKVGYPRPAGDPAQMELVAAKLAHSAQALREQRDAMERTRLTGSGGVVERTNQRVDRRKNWLLHRANELDALALEVKGRATSIQDGQATWDRAAQQVQPGWRP